MRAGTAPRRTAHWLNPWRLRVYPGLLLACFLLLSAVWVAKSTDGRSVGGTRPLGYDFVAFWAASHMARTGDAVAAYDREAIEAVETAAVPGTHSDCPWFYPPTLLLLILPLSLLPYLASYAVFMSGTLLAFVVTLRRTFAPPGSWMVLLAFPPVFGNVANGQNGLLTASLLGGALLNLSTRPVLAGAFFGLLTIKPQLGLLVPIALACGGYWRAFASAAVTGAALLAASVAVLGVDTLWAFLHGLPEATRMVAMGELPLAKIPTLLSVGTLLGVPASVSRACAGAAAIAAAVAVAWAWRQRVDFPLKAAALASGALLATPYLYSYDLAVAGLAIAWFARHASRTGWRRGEREVLATAWLLPLVMYPLASYSSVQIGPFVLAALFGVSLGRIRHERGARDVVADAPQDHDEERHHQERRDLQPGVHRDADEDRRQ